jgi:hypothetical protein
MKDVRKNKIIVEDTLLINSDSSYLGKTVGELEKEYGITIVKIYGHDPSLEDRRSPSDLRLQFLDILLISGDVLDTIRFIRNDGSRWTSFGYMPPIRYIYFDMEGNKILEEEK